MSLYRKILLFSLLFALLFLGGCGRTGTDRVWQPGADFDQPYASMVQEIGCENPEAFLNAFLARYSFFGLVIGGETYIGVIHTALYNLFLKIQNSHPDEFVKLRNTFALILSEPMTNYLFGANQLPNLDVLADNIHYLRTNYYIEDPYLTLGYTSSSALEAGLDILRQALSGSEIDVLNQFPVDSILPLPDVNSIPRMFQVQILANCTIVETPVFLPTVLVLNNLDFGTFNESTVVGKLIRQLLIMLPGPPLVFIIRIRVPGLPGAPPHPGEFCFPEEEDLIPIPSGGSGGGSGGGNGEGEGGALEPLPPECEPLPGTIICPDPPGCHDPNAPTDLQDCIDDHATELIQVLCEYPPST